MAAAGYAEVLTYPFVSLEGGGAQWLDASDERRPSVRLANPVSEEEPFLRAMLLPGLLATLARNIARGQHDVAVFEIGSVFRGGPVAGAMPDLVAGRRPSAEELARLEAALPSQPTHLAVALSGDREPGGWWGPGRRAGWADAVEAGRLAARAVDVTVDIEAAEVAPWHPGRCAALKVAGQVVGHAGELHPRVAEALSLPERSCAAELDLLALLRAAPEVVPSPPISAYPPATFDVAVVVDDSVPQPKWRVHSPTARGRCSRACGCSMSTRVPRWPRGRSLSPSRCGCARRTAR